MEIAKKKVMRATEYNRRKTNVTEAELWLSTGPLDVIEAWRKIVMKITEVSMNSRYLTNHEDQYSHSRIPISFIAS